MSRAVSLPESFEIVTDYYLPDYFSTALTLKIPFVSIS